MYNTPENKYIFYTCIIHLNTIIMQPTAAYCSLLPQVHAHSKYILPLGTATHTLEICELTNDQLIISTFSCLYLAVPSHDSSESVHV